MITLHGAMGYGVMVLHGAKNCNKVMASCDHGALACAPCNITMAPWGWAPCKRVRS
jgi:hypothetical protein